MQDVRAVVERIREALAGGGRLTVLTGAGVSAESGVPTFRDAGGLWESHRLEDVATPEAFARQPALVLAFYDARRRALRDVSPNAGHLALASIERRLGDRFTLITQNIDDLHERAGSKRVLHMHGELLRARCVRCGDVRRHEGDLAPEAACEVCGGRLRPHVVWFGEIPFHLDDEIPEALSAEVFLSVGTSGTVYPAAGFVAIARAQNALCVEANVEATETASAFQLRLVGPSGSTLPVLAEALVRA